MSAAKLAGLVLGGLLIAGGVLTLGAHGGGFGILLLGVIFVIAALFEGRYRRKPADAEPTGPDWQPTGETFRDEEAGVWVKVWFNPTTGERRYVPTDPPLR